MDTNQNETMTSTTSKPNNKRKLNIQIDDCSRCGKFGWYEYESISIPYIFRYETKKYVSIRMANHLLLKKYLLPLHPNIYQKCTHIESYHITKHEIKLLNEINTQHSDFVFGKKLFTEKDLIVPVTEVISFYEFLKDCHAKLTLKSSSDLDTKSGFMQLEDQEIPYVKKDEQKLIPSCYCQNEIERYSIKTFKIDGWDVSYMNFCYLNTRPSKMYKGNETVNVVPLELVQKSCSRFKNSREVSWPRRYKYLLLKKSPKEPGNWSKPSDIKTYQPLSKKQKMTPTSTTIPESTITSTKEPQVTTGPDLNQDINMNDIQPINSTINPDLSNKAPCNLDVDKNNTQSNVNPAVVENSGKEGQIIHTIPDLNSNLNNVSSIRPVNQEYWNLDPRTTQNLYSNYTSYIPNIQEYSYQPNYTMNPNQLLYGNYMPPNSYGPYNNCPYNYD